MRQVYRAIEAAFGIPYTPGAFEKAMADAFGAKDRINVNKELAEKMVLDPRNNVTGGAFAGYRPYYSGSELQIGPEEYRRSVNQYGALADRDDAKSNSPIMSLPKEPNR